MTSSLNKEHHSLRRAVEQKGHVLDRLGQWRRDKHAAQQSFRKLRKGFSDVPRVIITDTRKSYGAANLRPAA